MSEARKTRRSNKIKPSPRIYPKCPKSLRIFSVLIDPTPTKHQKLIKLSKQYHRAAFDWIFDHRKFSPALYVIFKFSVLYLDGDITNAEITEIEDYFDGGFLDLIVNLTSHDIVKNKYNRYNSDDRLRENYRELVVETLQMYLGGLSNNRSN